MRSITWLILFALIICGSVVAQPLTSITIGSNVPPPTPNGPVFVVDGTAFISTQTFEWVQGSSHVVQFPLSLDPHAFRQPVGKEVDPVEAPWEPFHRYGA